MRVPLLLSPLASLLSRATVLALVPSSLWTPRPRAASSPFPRDDARRGDGAVAFPGDAAVALGRRDAARPSRRDALRAAAAPWIAACWGGGTTIPRASACAVEKTTSRSGRSVDRAVPDEGRTYAEAQPNPRSTIGHSSFPLSQFSELSFALQNSDLLALYFAASWCPMSTPISFALDDAFGKNDVLLTSAGGRKTLSVVYVSSDKTPDEYNGYLRNRNWIAIPFESSQKSQLKRHFSTCARGELQELGIDRKHEIPTIIVIDSQTQGIITTNGASDIEQMGEGALEHWKDMQTWIRKTEVDAT